MRYDREVTDILELSAAIIDQGTLLASPFRITQQLSELTDGLSLIESFSNVVCLQTGEGLVLFDTSGKFTGAEVVRSLRRFSEQPVHSVVYTHGHVDHVGGAVALLADGAQRGHPLPRVIGHRNVAARFARYDRTNGYNLLINQRQFGGTQDAAPESFLPSGTPAPSLTLDDALAIEVGGERIELYHARGETDDHLWAWLPQHKAICCGDFFIWAFPNAGNPQKVQRYPLEWAGALRRMIAQQPELLVPAHGLPIAGRERIARALSDVAQALEQLVERTLQRMNQGATLDAILHEVRVEQALLDKPYLKPVYDDPEFVVRNVWRLYGGWHDGNPARLKPASQAALARELAALGGGAAALARRARELLASGELRLACELVELAVQAAPEDRDAHAARYEIYRQRAQAESALMARGIYIAAASDSHAVLHPDAPSPLTDPNAHGI